MSATRGRSSSVSRVLRRVRGFVRRRWGCREWVVVFKSLAECATDAVDRVCGVRFLVASPSDVAWIAPQLGEWATWCNGGMPVPDAGSVLGEQFANDDVTVVGVEDKPDGKVVLVLVYSRKDFSSEMLGEAFQAQRHVVARREWVASDHRGRGIAVAGACFAHAHVLRCGIDGVWAFILVGNTSSRRLHGKLGFEEVGRARIVTRLKRRSLCLRFGQSEPWRRRRIPFDRSGL